MARAWRHCPAEREFWETEDLIAEIIEELTGLCFIVR